MQLIILGLENKLVKQHMKIELTPHIFVMLNIFK
ncbi:hypothetical protein HMPREF0018_01872 [Acinetobacter radioresistens SH164]|nr:hypothetical protein HMPREF0018_01872 [Acinetobacter radioresistens SH164]